MDSFGKEEVFLHLAEKFKTLITCTPERYKNVSRIADEQSEFFTTDPMAGFINAINKRDIH